MAELNTFDIIATTTAGTLDTNIDALEKYVDEKLREYDPIHYEGDADSAKKGRAELNNAKKMIAQRRKEIMKALMLPYEDFDTRCKIVESKIDDASWKLDKIVKIKEYEEEDEKKAKIEVIWTSKNFELVPLEKIFNQKWLNKSFKEKEIIAEMDSKIERIYSDLKGIENATEANDVDVVKAYYLDCLDLSLTLGYAETLKNNRAKVQSEKEERAEREHNEVIESQIKEARQDFANQAKQSEMSSLALDALEQEEVKEEPKEYVVKICVTEDVLTKLKFDMSNLGIEYHIKELIF